MNPPGSAGHEKAGPASGGLAGSNAGDDRAAGGLEPGTPRRGDSTLGAPP